VGDIVGPLPLITLKVILANGAACCVDLRVNVQRGEF
jgi:hypothetical protein